MFNGHLKSKLSKTYFWILALLFSISENNNPPFPPLPPFPLVSYLLHSTSYSYIQSISKFSWTLPSKCIWSPVPSPYVHLCALVLHCSNDFLPVLPASTYCPSPKSILNKARLIHTLVGHPVSEKNVSSLPWTKISVHMLPSWLPPTQTHIILPLCHHVLLLWPWVTPLQLPYWPDNPFSNTPGPQHPLSPCLKCFPP